MKKILLHSCCAPCSSAVLERLGQEYHITVYYYNPNIDTAEEFARRAAEFEKLKTSDLKYGYEIVVEEYRPEEYDEAVRGLEHLGERSERCFNCYEIRMCKTAEYALAHGFDCFSTTLSLSPYKRADFIYEIGLRLANDLGVPYLDGDFRKRGGYQRSLELSREMGLYRQDYCGCKYSKAEMEAVRARRSR